MKYFDEIDMLVYDQYRMVAWFCDDLSCDEFATNL